MATLAHYSSPQRRSTERRQQLSSVLPSSFVHSSSYPAIHGDPEVRDRVVAAVRSLAGEPRLRVSTLREVVRWATDPDRLRAPGIRAFLALAETPADVIPRTLAESERIGLLADGWCAAFHDPGHVAEARKACLGWLESAAQGAAP
ncbi:MAG TPA: hypothetical protein VKV80_09655 [Streptosporangiaceae bacterium]|nr:hypothetical protein [Streptosporangiaceae bacterium]